MSKVVTQHNTKQLSFEIQKFIVATTFVVVSEKRDIVQSLSLQNQKQWNSPNFYILKTFLIRYLVNSILVCFKPIASGGGNWDCSGGMNEIVEEEWLRL